MRIAHLIMAYKNPSQLERLINRLEHPQCHIFIHLDKKIDINDFKYLENIKKVYFINNRILCNWGGFSFVNAITESIREILNENVKYDFINLMSAQDYPIKPIKLIFQYFEKHQGFSFITYEESSKSEWWEHAKMRYELFHFSDLNFKGKYLIQKVLNKFMPKRKFPLPDVLYGSARSSWWTLSTDCVEYIIDYIDKNPQLMKFMKYTWAADEFLYPTIIMNSPYGEKVHNNNFRYIEWEEGKSNPQILDHNNITSLIDSEHFFARKFDITIDVEVLDLLDKIIIDS